MRCLVDAGYLFPISLFKWAGIDNYRFFVRNVNFLGSHDTVVYAVANGRADLGALKE